MSKLTLRIRLLTKINSGFRIVFNMRLRKILRAYGNNSVHGIHLPTVCVVQQGLEMTKSNEQSGRAIRDGSLFMVGGGTEDKYFSCQKFC